MPVTASQHANTRDKRAELKDVPGFAEQFLPDRATPAAGDRFVNERLGHGRCAVSRARDSTRSTAARSRTRSLRILARIGSPVSRCGSRTTPRAGEGAARAPAPPRHRVQLPASHAGLGVTHDPRHLRATQVSPRRKGSRICMDWSRRRSRRSWCETGRSPTRHTCATPPEQFLAPAAIEAGGGVQSIRPERARMAATPERRRHRLDGRHRRRGTSGELYPERVLGVRLRGGARGDRHPVAEPRVELQAPGRRPQRHRAGPQAVSYPEPGPVASSTMAAPCPTARWAARASPRPRPRC